MTTVAEKIAADAGKKMDELIKRAERNGWNAALNAARELIGPSNESIRLRTLYRREE